jgi:uncharacterized membrane protein YccC
MFHHISTITSRTVKRFAGHTPPLGARRSTNDAVPSAVCLYHGCSRKTTNPEHYRIARLIATCVSFALCLPYLWIFPFTPVGMAALLGIGTVVMTLLGRRDDIVTTAITTTVVMVVAAMSPQDAWHQPLLRLVDTVVGIAVGVTCKWIASFLLYRFIGEQA